MTMMMIPHDVDYRLLTVFVLTNYLVKSEKQNESVADEIKGGGKPCTLSYHNMVTCGSVQHTHIPTTTHRIKNIKQIGYLGVLGCAGG